MGPAGQTSIPSMSPPRSVVLQPAAPWMCGEVSQCVGPLAGAAMSRGDAPWPAGRTRWLPFVLLLLTPYAWGHGGPASTGPRAGRPGRSPYLHLQGDVRWRWLYSSNHFFLRIGADGRVDGMRQKNPDSVMEIRSVEVGTVALRAVRSGFFVAMTRKGKIYGAKEFGLDCQFRERIEENGYTTYASRRWHHAGRPMFLSLNGKGRPRWGAKTGRHHPSTHFLPLLVS